MLYICKYGVLCGFSGICFYFYICKLCVKVENMCIYIIFFFIIFFIYFFFKNRKQGETQSNSAQSGKWTAMLGGNERVWSGNDRPTSASINKWQGPPDGSRLTLVTGVIKRWKVSEKGLPFSLSTALVPPLLFRNAAQPRPRAVIERFRFFEPRLLISLYRSRSSGQLGGKKRLWVRIKRRHRLCARVNIELLFYPNGNDDIHAHEGKQVHKTGTTIITAPGCSGTRARKGPLCAQLNISYGTCFCLERR